MEEKYIREKLLEAITQMFANQPNFFAFTSETNQSEWNISHHLANEVSRAFDGYDCDLDVIERNHNNKRPDIIIHKRGSNENNLLVIEVKRDERDMDGEEVKINDYWFTGLLSYDFGAVITINENNDPSVRVIKNPNPQNIETTLFFS